MSIGGLGNAEIGALYFRVEADMKNIQASLTALKGQLAGAEGAAKTHGAGIVRSMNAIGISMKALTTATVIGGIVTGVYQIGKAALKASSALEQNTASLEVMLGSSGKAKKMLDDITQFAAKTPYQMQGLVESAKLMLNFGVSADEIMPSIKMIGDVSGGSAERMHSMTLAFSQMSASGRLMGQDLLQMVNAGFNPLQEISQKTGESMGSLKKKMEGGGISVQMVKDAFKSATSEGGRFYGMMDKQSQTLGGLFSTLKDNIEITLAKVGNQMAPAFKTLMATFGEMSSEGGPASLAIAYIGKTAAITANSLTILVATVSRLVNAAQQLYLIAKEQYVIQTKGVNSYEEALMRLTAAEREEFVANHERIKALDNQSDRMDALRSQAVNQIGIQMGLIDEVKKESEALKDNTKEKKKAEEQGKGLNKELDKQKKALDDLKAQSLGEWVSSFAKVADSMPKMNAGFNQMAKALQTIAGLDDKLKMPGLSELQKAGIKMQAFGDMATGLANTVMGAIQDIAAYTAQKAQTAFDDMVTQQNFALAMMQEQELAAYGLKDETDAQKAEKEIAALRKKLAKTTSVKKRNEIKEQIQLKQSEKKKAEINEEFAQRQQLLEAGQEMYRMNMQRREAQKTKQMALMSAIVNMASAIIASWAAAFSSGVPWPAALAMGIISTALIGAIGGLQIAMISGANLGFAEGGLITQPTYGLIGEGRDAEGVFPLNDDVYGRFADGIVNSMGKMSEDRSDGVSLGGEDTIVIHNVTTLDGKVIEENVDTRRRKRGRRIGAGNYAYGSAY